MTISAVRALPYVGSVMGHMHVRRRHRRRWHRRAMVQILFVLFFLVLVVGLSAISNAIADLRVAVVAEPPPAPPMELGQPARTPELTKRPEFRHSVIRGGAYTPGEVEDAIHRDPIVAAHYSAMNPRALRVEVLPNDRIVYMSYRVGDDIFWTRKAVRLKQGETILTDGVNTIRARCGNCIADAPMTPTTDDEPGETEFDTVIDDPGIVALPPPLDPGSFPPISGFPVPWLVGGPSDPSGPNAVGGNEWIDIPVFGYVPDSTELDPLNDVLESLASENTWPNFVGGYPRPDDYLPPIGLPPSWRPQDPDDPGSSFDPGDPGNPSDPGNPIDPTLPTPHTPMVPAPEPGTFLLVGGGLATLLARRVKRPSSRFVCRRPLRSGRR